MIQAGSYYAQRLHNPLVFIGLWKKNCTEMRATVFYLIAKWKYHVHITLYIVACTNDAET